MCRTILLTIFLVGQGILAQVAYGEFEREVINRGKKSTALVIAPTGRKTGTAFCIDPAGYFLTNEHVVGSTVGATVSLVLNGGEKSEKEVSAIVVRADKKTDLALIKANGRREYSHLAMGGVEDLFETQQIVAFGYPFGTALKLKEKKYPTISVNVGRVTALRKVKGQLKQIQVDATLNPGNSGGPVVDSTGKVIGVVRAGVLRSGVNFIIPVSALNGFLGKPDIDFQPPVIEYGKRFKPHQITARVVTFTKPRPKFTLRLLLGDSQGKRRIVEGKHVKEDVYRFSFSPLVRSTARQQLPVEIVYDDGLIRGKMDNQRLKGIKIAKRLADLSRLYREGDHWIVQTKDGRQTKLPVLKMLKPSVFIGGSEVPLDLKAVESIVVYQQPQEANRVAVEIVASLKGKQVASTRGLIKISAPPVSDVSPPTQNLPPEGIYRPPTAQPEFTESNIELKLPGTYTSVALGNSGRFFIFHLKEQKKIIIFDVVPGRIVHEIPDVSDDVILTAGRDKLIVVIPNQRVMQRWSLKSFKREAVAKLPGSGTTYRALMGCNGDGPLLLGAEDATLVDIQTMEPIKVEGGLIGNREKYQLRVSANGRTFAGIPQGYGPVAFSRMQVDGSKTRIKMFGGTSNRVRWAWPSADGTLMTSTVGNFGPNLDVISAKWLDKATIYPTVDPRYFLAVRITTDKNGKFVAKIDYCVTNDQKIIHSYIGLQEFAARSTAGNGVPKFQIDLHQVRIHYLPWANLLVTLPHDNQRIVLRRYDLLKTIEQSGNEYLFVDSIPPRQAFLGRTLNYPIAVKSKGSGVKYHLESGPDGMRVSDTGLVTWNVPTDFPEETAQAIITVSNKIGKEALHSFRIQVKEPVVVRSASTK